MGSKIERKFMAHFIDATFSFTGVGETISWTPNWYRLGEDLEEYQVEMNPIGEIEKNILGDDVPILTGYDMKGEADTFYAYRNDALFVKLQNIIDNCLTGASCLTLALEVQLWHGRSSGSGGAGEFTAVLRPCMVIPGGYGGDTSGYQIPFEVSYLNNFVKYGYFSTDGSGSGTFVT